MKDDLKTEGFQCALPVSSHAVIQLGHGSGGRMMNDLIEECFKRTFDNPYINKMDDGAVLQLDGSQIAFSTDSFVVDPIFFPGGNIGDLAVNGTVNDLCMCGARPLYLSAGFILEEGFPLEHLQEIVDSMNRTAVNAGVVVATGDTKVVDRGKGDKIFINTSGIGVISHNIRPSSHNLKAGDKIILSGSIGEHGIAILSKRQGLTFETDVESDTASLCEPVQLLIRLCGSAVHALRDATRGGLAAVLNEFAGASEVEIRISESEIPVKPQVAGACEILGLDPLFIANEGKFIAVIAGEKASEALAVLRSHPLGRDAAIIGEVIEGKAGMVSLQTGLGGWRIVDMPAGEQLPRIC